MFREVDYNFNKSARVKKNAYGRINYIKNGYYNAMIFGSSRTHASIHPQYFYKNLGIIAHSEAYNYRYPHYFYSFYKKFKNAFGIPKYLFYGVDYFMFRKKSINRETWLLKRGRNRVRRIRIKKELNKNSKLFSSISISFRLKKKNDNTFEAILSQLTIDQNKKNNNINGISNYLGKKTVLKPHLTRKYVSWKKYRYINSNHGEGEHLKLLFDDLEKDGVMVFLIGIPSYIGTYSSNIQQDKFENDISALIKGYDNFYFLNYNNPEKFDMKNPIYFSGGGYGRNNSHMSYYGSEPFNKILTEDIGKIIKRAELPVRKDQE